MQTCPTIPYNASAPYSTPSSPDSTLRNLGYHNPLACLYFSGNMLAANKRLSLEHCARVGVYGIRIEGIPVSERLPLLTDPVFHYSPSGGFAKIAHTKSSASYIGWNKPFLLPTGQNSLWRDGHVEWHNWPGLDRLDAAYLMPVHKSFIASSAEGWMYIGSVANTLFTWGKR